MFKPKPTWHDRTCNLQPAFVWALLCQPLETSLCLEAVLCHGQHGLARMIEVERVGVNPVHAWQIQAGASFPRPPPGQAPLVKGDVLLRQDYVEAPVQPQAARMLEPFLGLLRAVRGSVHCGQAGPDLGSLLLGHLRMSDLSSSRTDITCVGCAQLGAALALLGTASC